jgi:hypothetical protein
VRVDSDDELLIPSEHIGVMLVARSSRWSALFELQQGRTHDALDRIFDALWFGGDLLRTGDDRTSRNAWRAVILSLECCAEVLAVDPETSAERIVAELNRFAPHVPDARGVFMDYGIDRVHWALEGGYRTPGGGRITDPVEQWMYDRSRQPFYIVDVADALLDLEWERSLLEDPWPDVLRVHEVIDSRSGSGALFNVEYRFESTRFDTNRRGVLAMISLLRAAASEGGLVETDPFGDGTARIQRRQRSLTRRGSPPLGRQLDHRKRGQIELQARETGTREHNGIDSLPFAELAQARGHVAAQRHRDGLRRVTA